MMKGLTERQREVLALVAQGKSNREIGQQLCISVKTVEYHVSEILGKLGFSNRTEAAIYALQEGLVEEGDGKGDLGKSPGKN